MNNNIETHPFVPFIPEGAKVLMLGTFPPAPHRWCMPFYYPNFQNDMWRIMGIIFFGDKEHFIVKGEKRFDQPRIEAFISNTMPDGPVKDMLVDGVIGGVDGCHG